MMNFHEAIAITSSGQKIESREQKGSVKIWDLDHDIPVILTFLTSLMPTIDMQLTHHTFFCNLFSLPSCFSLFSSVDILFCLLHFARPA